MEGQIYETSILAARRSLTNHVDDSISVSSNDPPPTEEFDESVHSSIDEAMIESCGMLRDNLHKMRTPVIWTSLLHGVGR